MDAGTESPKRRISRACDKCHLSRTKCNGGQPCCRCIGFSMDCTYSRKAKKRGRIAANSAPVTVKCSMILPKHTSPLLQPEPEPDNLPHLSAPFVEQLFAGSQSCMRDDESQVFPLPSQPYDYNESNIKYPVLRPLLEHISHIVPDSLASELLESYFTTIPGNGYQPASPFLQTFIFRKSSILDPGRPRTCSPALLCSMLWVASLSGPNADARTSLSKKLVQITLELLYPMWHAFLGGTKDYVWLRSLEATHGSVKLDSSQAAEDSDRSLADTAAGAIDLLVTIIHIATVCSASEQKGASLRWWAIAWAMAKDLKLHRELPRIPGLDTGRQFSPQAFSPEFHVPLSEQHREERRRVWWLLYMIDRHLSLCYNRPLVLTDVECATLLQPLDDKLWQEIPATDLEQGAFAFAARVAGPPTICKRGDLFGWFLPLMTLLGGIIDMFRAINHPRFGKSNTQTSFSDAFTHSLSMQLNEYSSSLDICENSTPPNQMPEYRTGFAYARYILNVIHILLFCKWDPISLIDDDDLWISSAAFASALRHAIDAAKILEQIMNEDIDLSYMPWFFGIELLHGSIIILLVVDKLERQTTPSMIKACELIVRAHEACNATLCNTYQRNFRKLMLSTLAQAKNRSGSQRSENLLAEKDWRRQILLLYRWTNDGTGLAQ